MKCRRTRLKSGLSYSEKDFICRKTHDKKKQEVKPKISGDKKCFYYQGLAVQYRFEIDCRRGSTTLVLRVRFLHCIPRVYFLHYILDFFFEEVFTTSCLTRRKIIMHNKTISHQINPFSVFRLFSQLEGPIPLVATVAESLSSILEVYNKRPSRPR